MANDPTRTGITLRLPVDIRRWARATGGARGALLAVAVLTLAAIAAFLFFKTRGVDIGKQNEALGYFRELKAIDARWDVELMRARIEFAPPLSAAMDFPSALARIRQGLAASAQDVKSPLLERGLPDLNKAFAEKADLVAQFRKASAAAKQALRRVMGAEAEFAGLVRASWRDFPDRERLVAMENVVILLLAEAQKYYFAPTAAQRKNVEALVADLRDAAPRLPPALTSGIARLDSNIQELLRATPAEDTLFNKLALHSAGPRVDSLAHAFNHEVGQTLASRELYRVYLMTCSGALLILIGYLSALLSAAWRRIKQENFALQAENEELGKRLVEDTQEPPEAIRKGH